MKRLGKFHSNATFKMSDHYDEIADKTIYKFVPQYKQIKSNSYCTRCSRRCISPDGVKGLKSSKNAKVQTKRIKLILNEKLFLT